MGARELAMGGELLFFGRANLWVRRAYEERSSIDGLSESYCTSIDFGNVRKPRR